MDDIIKESDLIQVDGTIDNLIKQLSELNSAFADVAENVKRSASNMQKSLKSASGATKEGRKAIDEATEAANRLERAQQELAFALSETGKQVALLKAETRDVNKATVEQQRQLAHAVSSYDRLNAEIVELTKLYKSLTAAEREDVNFGERVISELKEKNAELKKLEQAIKPVVEQMTRLQKAEKELAYWQSEEGKQVLELKAKIRELTAAKKEQKAVTDPLANAEKRLSDLMRGEKDALMETNLEISKQTKLRKLAIKENEAQEGSYAKLSAQYARAKFELEQLNLTLPENADRISRLKHELNMTYGAMRKFQEQTGVHSLGVGDYKAGFVGLSNSVQQIVRELPAATISLNTFFLAISNNVPIFMDEFRRARLAFEADVEAINKAAANSTDAANQIGKLETPIKKVIKSLFSWQTALVLVLTVLPMYGEEILAWVGKLFQSENAINRISRALKNIRKEMKNTNGNFGENMVTVRKLTDEYKNLSTEAEKKQWIKDNEDAWRDLNVAIYSVADAEKFFIENSAKVKDAFVQRARAAAAYKITEDKFKDLLLKEEKLRQIRESGVEAYSDLSSFGGPGATAGGSTTYVSAQDRYDADVKYYETKIGNIRKEIDLYYDLASAAETAANAELGEYTDGQNKYGKGGRDVTKYIENMKVKVTKEAEEAITKLQISEFAKRRKEAIKTYNEEVGSLQNTYNENKRILDGYYKLREPLTEQQKAELEAKQQEIEETLKTYKSVYDKTLSDIAADERIATKEREEELVQIRLSAVKKGSDKEYRLREESLKNQLALAKLKNDKLIQSERQDENAIEAKYQKQITDLYDEQRISRLSIVKNSISLQLEAVSKGGKAEYELRKSEIEAQKNMEIEQNKLLTDELRVQEKDIEAKYNKQLEDLEYEHQMNMLDAQREGIELRLGALTKGSKDELDIVLQQIELEKKAAIEANKNLAEDLRQNDTDIENYYKRRADFAQGNYDLSQFRATQTALKTNVVAGSSFSHSVEYGDEGSRLREVFDISQNILDIDKQIALYNEGKLDLGEEQLANLKLQKAELEKQKNELSGFKGFMSDIAEGGIAGGILGQLGFNDDAIGAFNSMTDTILDNINAIMEAEIELAEQAVENAQKRTDAAKSAYEAEVEARNKGYANNVATAKKELEQEKKNQREKQKQLEAAQKRQEALNSVIQASSLVTASANLWSSFSSVPIVGPALALAAIATMWSSFAVAKIKARQVATASDEYGEGGLEFLEGGSHASGNDIDLGTYNGRGRRMKAEGGEALAIINKRQTRKYRKVLPDVIDSFNKGTFEDKYLKAFSSSDGMSITLNSSNNVDLTRIERDVRSIKQQNETRYFTTPDGYTIMQRKNVKRIIKS